jgi:hypothetical protein
VCVRERERERERETEREREGGREGEREREIQRERVHSIGEYSLSRSLSLRSLNGRPRRADNCDERHTFSKAIPIADFNSKGFKALTFEFFFAIAMKDAAAWVSVSAFAPICNPTQSAWGRKVARKRQHTHTHTHTQSHSHTRTHARTYANTHTHTHTHTHTGVCGLPRQRRGWRAFSKVPCVVTSHRKCTRILISQKFGIFGQAPRTTPRSS